MGISRKTFKVWLSCTILYWIAIGVIINAGGFFPARYQANFPLQPGLPPFQKDAGWQVDDPLHKPLYEIIRSPSAEKLPIQFTWLGYQGPIWNQHIHSRKTQRFEFMSGETLDLPDGLTDADSQYVKDEFWRQRWARWRDIFTPYLWQAILVPLAVLAAIWGIRQFRISVLGWEPPPEKPRLPYSPQMQWLRKITIYAAAAELLFWFVFAITANKADPQPLMSIVWSMLPAYLAPLAALVMSFLWRGPIAAALLVAFGFYLLFPILVVSIVPEGWLPQ